jgi:hypothetical protein
LLGILIFIFIFIYFFPSTRKHGTMVPGSRLYITILTGPRENRKGSRLGFTAIPNISGFRRAFEHLNSC